MDIWMYTQSIKIFQIYKITSKREKEDIREKKRAEKKGKVIKQHNINDEENSKENNEENFNEEFNEDFNKDFNENFNEED
ncbi:hypothetical protein RhiirA4_456404 [Rhizophagus irregularis]|uniref:Uncharacterized protein n=1 Tax=Rhizophagus irregularis TaxID=588596 RepID=A0A2I1G7H4_9GLOM|nr:hypothetical protein RhiirA4_456404 [Rhizophagus irregularis]